MPFIDRLRVDEVIRNGYQFDFGGYISRGFQVFGKEWLMFSLYCLISTFIMIASLVTIIGFFFLIFPIYMGYAIAADKVEAGEKLELSDFFGGFKNFGAYAVITLLFIVGYLLIFTPFLLYFGFASLSDMDSYFGIVSSSLFFVYFFVVFIGFYLLMFCVFFAPFLIHYGGYSGIEAIKTSVKLTMKNFWWQALFLFVTGIIGGVGQYLCIIGMFASIPVSVIMNYMLVKSVLIDGGSSELDEIGKSGNDFYAKS